VRYSALFSAARTHTRLRKALLPEAGPEPPLWPPNPYRGHTVLDTLVVMARDTGYDTEMRLACALHALAWFEATRSPALTYRIEPMPSLTR
jgi:hypothetical protein